MSEPIEVLLKRLTSIARGRETPKGFHFFCQIGSAGWSGGVTTLQCSGTGWVLLSHRPPNSPPSDEDELYSCYISTRDLRALVKVLMEHPFWEFKTDRWESNDDDETNIHLRLMDTGRGFAWDTQIWSGEREKQHHLDRLLQTVNLIVTTVSEGKVRPL